MCKSERNNVRQDLGLCDITLSAVKTEHNYCGNIDVMLPENINLLIQMFFLFFVEQHFEIMNTLRTSKRIMADDHKYSS